MNPTPRTATAEPAATRPATMGPAAAETAAAGAADDDPPAPHEELLGIGAAAAAAGVSERALRYYQQLGLIVPSCTTPGGLRRYSAENLARVGRIRELQTLLGLNLDEIAIVLRNEDRMAQIRRAYKDEHTSDDERLRLAREGLVLLEGLRETVEAKRAALECFLTDLEARIGRTRDLLPDRDLPSG
jgi:MerR family transcriptional regulator, repressor of the yfmOP operon